MLKLRVKLVTYESEMTHKGDTKRPKSKENHLEILKIYAFCQKIQQRASGLGENAVGVLIYL